MNKPDITRIKRNLIFNTIQSTIQLFIGVIFTLISINFCVKGGGLFLIPFVICGSSVIIFSIVSLMKCANMKKLIEKLKSNDYSGIEELENKENKLNNLKSFGIFVYNFGFFLFWFGFLIIYDILAILNWNNSWQLFLFSLIFWIFGINALRLKIKKR